MAPEERLRGEKQGCAERGGLTQPAFGERVKSPDAGQEGDEVEQVAQVGDAPGDEGLERSARRG